MAQATSRVYHAPGVDPGALESHAQELAEWMSCYFPVRFTPPKSDPHGVTRQQVRLSHVRGEEGYVGPMTPVERTWHE